MKRIVLIGAGLSTKSLVPYLKDRLVSHQWYLRVLDRDLTVAQSRLGHETGQCSAAAIDITDTTLLELELADTDVAISMVPAHMHMNVAKACLKLGIHLLTASYLSDEMKELDQEVKAKKLVFLNECGLDPGIDHMSAMRLLDDIRDNGGDIKLFESFTFVSGL